MAFAAVPLRLYVRRRASSQKHYQTSPVAHRRKSYLAGEADQRPSASVIRKVAALGADYEEVTEQHPAIALLSTVNSWQNGFELSCLRALYWQVTGNAYIHPVLGSLGVPQELYLLPSQWVQIIPSRTDFIAGYVYGRKPNDVQFTAEEVIQWKLPSLSDVFYGMGWVEALWTALGIHNAKRTMDTAKLDNFARPDWLLAIKSGGSPQALDRLEATIESKLLGSKNSGRFLSVTGDVEAIPLNFDVPEFGDPDKVIEEIASVSGVPLNKLRGNDPVKANSENQDTGWLRDTILPYCRMDEEQLNGRYLPLFDLGEDAVLAYDSPVPDDRKSTVAMYVAQAGGPYQTVNEVRAADGLKPIEGGDAIRKPVVKEDPNDPAEPPVKTLKKSERMARVLPDGSGIRKVLTKAFHEQRNAVIRQINEPAKSIEKGDGDGAPKDALPAKFIPLEAWDESIAFAARPVIEIIMQEEGEKLLTRVGASADIFSVFEKNIPKAAAELALNFAESTNETTSMQLDEALTTLRQEISDGLVQGDTRVELTRRVERIFDHADKDRAETIARTEGSRAAHTGELMSAVESKVVSRKFWLLSSDACPVCDKILADNPDGVPLDQPFAELGGKYGTVMTAPAHPRCQCSNTYSTKDDGSR